MSLVINCAESPRELISKALEWCKSGQKPVLATLINIEGNAPYPVGAQMLVAENGDFIGQITGGCAEQAIADQAIAVLNQGSNKTHRYGLDSPFFDIQLPCGSGIDVHFDCALSESDLSSIDAELQARRSVTRMIEGVEKYYRPTARIIVVGQGPILVSLTRLATLSGFDVLCVVQNDAAAAPLETAGFRGTLLNTAQPFLGDYYDRYTALVSLFHEHELENPLVLEALNSDAFYVGALGSKRTHANRLQQLSEMGALESNLSRIKGPVGLNIAAQTPEQIAVSILAEVISEMNRNGTH